jgi:para-nitrobenzyl esterase
MSDVVNRRGFINIAGMTLASMALARRVCAQTAQAVRTSVVETAAGKVRGLVREKVLTFRGIPYGASTAGPRRFLPADKPSPWTGVRDALEFGLRAPQLQAPLVPEMGVMDPREPMGEDCLRLNVWTMGAGADRKRPVMVWMHGGGYTAGSGAWDVWDGTHLAAKHDVVVVSLNHRLNVFGFLYLADMKSERFAQSSNLSLTDIVAALQWVRENIAAFGGDPANVTIFGQSGGGNKVSLLLGMPSASGLFQRAIVESGTSVRGLSRSDATETAHAVLAKLAVPADNVERIQSVPIQQLLAVTGPGGAMPGGRIAPVLDATLPAAPFDPVATTISADVPLLIGSNETELTFNPLEYYDPLDDDALRAKVRQVLRAEDAAADRVIAVYRKNRPKASNLDLYLILNTDASDIRIGLENEAERKAALSKAPVYKYYFQWYSPVREGKLRAMHCMELPFVFENVDVARTLVGDGKDRYALANRMSTAWTNFARSGNPNHKDLPEWPRFDATRRATMVFNTECRVADNPYGEERAAIQTARKASIPTQ